VTQTQETVVLTGHIIDSLILAKVLDTILMMGGTFDIQDMQIGKTREEPSRARITVRASSAKLLSEILHAIQPHGASVESERDCRLSAAPADGIFPDEFYAINIACLDDLVHHRADDVPDLGPAPLPRSAKKLRVLAFTQHRPVAVVVEHPPFRAPPETDRMT